MWRAVAIAVLGAVALSAQAPLRPSPQAPPRDTRPSRPSAPTATAAPETSVVRGRVVVDRADVTVPLVKARVQISGGTQQIDPVFTDSQGTFEFTGLSAGHYTVAAEKTGYAPTRYGALSLFDPFVPIELKAGSTEELEIRMPRAAAIFGRIVDDLGDPVTGARVSASVVRYEGNTRRIQPVSKVPAVSDDLGEYRIGGLAPGRYLLSVLTRGLNMDWVVTELGFLTRDGISASGPRVGFGKIYYPGGNSASGATPIDVTVGEEHGGVDIAVAPFRPARLATTATGGPVSGSISTQLAFVPAGEPETDIPGQRIQYATLPGVDIRPPTVLIDPGDWIVVVRRNALGALARVSLSSGDDASITLPLQPGARLSGRIVFEGSSRRPPPSSVHIDVIGAGSDIGVSPLLLAPGGPFAAKPDGTFEIAGLIGTVELIVADPIGWAVKSINVGDRDVLGSSMTFQGTETLTGLEVVLTDQVADLSGTVVFTDSRRAPGCKVAVFPAADTTYNPRRMRLMTANQRGQFFMDDLPPGDYVAAVHPTINPVDWTTPSVLTELRGGALPFTIASREKKTLTLTCQTAQ